jgi:hypothetical protein
MSDERNQPQLHHSFVPEGLPKIKMSQLRKVWKKTNLQFYSILSMSNVTIMLSVLGQSRQFLVAHTQKKKKKKTPLGAPPSIELIELTIDAT